LYQELCKALGEVFRQLAAQKEAKVEEGHLLSDPVHMLKWLLSVDDCAILNLERLPQPLDSVKQRQEKLRRPSTRDQRGDLGLIWASVSRYTVRTFTTDFCDTKNGGIVSRQPVAQSLSFATSQGFCGFRGPSGRDAEMALGDTTVGSRPRRSVFAGPAKAPDPRCDLMLRRSIRRRPSFSHIERHLRRPPSLFRKRRISYG
jgi:hypothetical protein